MTEIDVEKFLGSRCDALLNETTEMKMFKIGVCY